MPWTSIADWADGDILSATKLNQVVDNLEYLWALAQSVNPPRPVDTVTAGDGADGSETMVITHRHRYLYFYFSISQGTFDDMSVSYGATTVFSDATDRSNPYVYEQTIDLDPFAFTVGQTYTIHIDVGGEPGSASNTLQLTKIYEHP